MPIPLMSFVKKWVNASVLKNVVMLMLIGVCAFASVVRAEEVAVNDHWKFSFDGENPDGQA